MRPSGPGSTARALWLEAFRVEDGGFDLRAALAGGVATAAPLAAGVLADEPAIGLTAALGALNAALVVPRGPLRTRLGWSAVGAAGFLVAIVLATAVGDSVAASAAVAFAWIALTAFLRTFGRDGGLAGFVCGATYVILDGIPAGSLSFGTRVLWFALGSLAGFALMTLARGRRGEPPPPPRGPVLAPALRQLGDAIAHDRLLRAHALRVATLVAGTTLLYKALGLDHGYWVPLTVLAVLQPEEHASQVRALQRAAGTLVGTVAIAVITVVTGSTAVLVACTALAAFGLFGLIERGYFWLVVLLTPTALMMVSVIDYQGPEIALERVGMSAIGIVGGLAVAELLWRLEAHAPSSHQRPRAGGAR